MTGRLGFFRRSGLPRAFWLLWAGTIATPLITDTVPPAARPRAFGYLYWAINVGAAIAPVAAGLLARTNYLLLFVGDALTTFLFGLIVLWGVRETRPAELEGRLSKPVGERVRALWAEPVLLAFTGLARLVGASYGLPAIVTTFGGYALSVGIWALCETIGAPVVPSVVADLAPID